MAWIMDTYSMNKGHSVARRRHRQAARRSAARSGAPRRPPAARCSARARPSRSGGARSSEPRGGPGLRQRRLATSREFIAEAGARVVAVSDSTAAIYNENGIDVQARFAHKRENGTLAGLAGAETITNEELLARRLRHPRAGALESEITEQNAAQDQGEDHRRGRERPDHADADEILRDTGVLVVPDILANAGGVTVSYFEWVQGLQEYFWKEAVPRIVAPSSSIAVAMSLAATRYPFRATTSPPASAC